jgi:hypothetical protein
LNGDVPTLKLAENDGCGRVKTIVKIMVVIAAVVSAAVAGAQDTEGERPLGVVELFTSQGCNSCPPADRALSRFAGRGDIVALGYHVDYWDYLGWRDTLGSKENSRRQYEYARSLKRRGVYTPQAIVNGRSHTNGGRYDEISSTLETYANAGNGLSVGLTVIDMGDLMRVSVSEGAAPKTEVKMVVVYFKQNSDVLVERGENAGKSIKYVNAVVDVQTVGMWHGDAMTVDIPVSEMDLKNADGCAVLLQETVSGGYPGPILGAAILPRQSS